MTDNDFKKNFFDFRYDTDYLNSIKKKYKSSTTATNSELEAVIFKKISFAHQQKLEFTLLSQYETSTGHTPLIRVLTSNLTSKIGISPVEISYMIKKSSHEHVSKYGNNPLMVALKKNTSERLGLTLDDFRYMVFNSNLEHRDSDGLNAAMIAVKCFETEKLPLTKELLDYMILSTESLGFDDFDIEDYKKALSILSKTQGFRDEVFASKTHTEAVMLGYHDKLNEVLKNYDLALTQNKRLAEENVELKKDFLVFRSEMANFFNKENKNDAFLKPGIPSLSAKMQGIIHNLKKDFPKDVDNNEEEDTDWDDEEKSMEEEISFKDNGNYFKTKVSVSRDNARKIKDQIEKKLSVKDSLKKTFK